MLCLAGMSIRTDLLGVTSIVRALGLSELAYRSLLKFFHSDAIKLDVLVSVWTRLVLRLFEIVTIGGHLVALLDGLKVPKEGRKMPAVKCLHQESDNNSKAEYIMGHSFQCLAFLARGIADCFAAVPIISEIHEGLVWSNRDQRTLMNKAAGLVEKVLATVNRSVLIVADAYYCNAKFINLLLEQGCHLISRLRNNAVAYYPAPPKKPGVRGRPKKYGKKVALSEFFGQMDLFTTVQSPVYGEDSVMIRYFSIDLLWEPLKRLVRFVLVEHPVRGKIILCSTDMSLCAIDVIAGYGYRFKIELSFKQALRVIGTYSYHFWMKAMVPLKRYTGDQYLHRKTGEYRDAISNKIKAYETHVAMGCIAQGLLLNLCLNRAELVWKNFGSWLRTMKVNQAPSEFVAANALRSRLPDFMAGTSENHAMAKFLRERVDPERAALLRLIS